MMKYELTIISFLTVAKETARSSTEPENNDELEQITIARALRNYRLKEKISMSNPNAPIPFPKKFQIQNPRPTSPQPPPAATSKILPLICQKTASRSRHPVSASPASVVSDNSAMPQLSATSDIRRIRRPKFPAAGAAPYVPIRQMRPPCQGMAPPVTIRTAIPVFSPPPPTAATMSLPVLRAPPVRVAPPVTIRQAVPVFAAPPVRIDEPVPSLTSLEPVPTPKDDAPTISSPSPEDKLPVKTPETEMKTEKIPAESETVQSLAQLKI